MRIRVIAASMSVCLLGITAGCGDDSSPSDRASTTTEKAGSSTSSADLDAFYEGTFGELPSSSPPPAEGKNVWAVSGTETSPTLAAVSANVKEAAETLGWDVTVFDGKGTPEGWNAGMRQAIADGADAIVTVNIECAPISSSLKQAKAKGIKVVSITGMDCDGPGVEGEPLFDSFVSGSSEDFLGTRELQADMRAGWVLDSLGGEPGKIVVLHETDYPAAILLDELTNERIRADCPECEIVEVDFVLSDLNTQLKGKVQAALVQNPDAKVVMFPYDAAITLGGAAAIQSSGRAGEITVMGGECALANVELIREGAGQDACVGIAFPWLGWAAADDTNRLLQGEEPVPAGVGLQLIDAEHNLPAEGKAFEGPASLDFRGNYKRIWNEG